MEIIAYKSRAIPLFADKFNMVYSDNLFLKWMHFLNIEVESDDGSYLESLVALRPGRRIFIKRCTQAWTGK